MSRPWKVALGSRPARHHRVSEPPPACAELCERSMGASRVCRRLGEVEDIALMALYLASPAASWVTGKVFEVDGGTVSTTWPFESETL